jgi:thiamine-phosphate pyrophosphorylase
MKKYLITDKSFYTQDKESFIKTLNSSIIKHNPDYILYRDKENNNYKDMASEFIKLCKRYKNIKSFIHQDIDLAISLDATGVHLTSSQIQNIKDAKEKNLEVIVSTHTLEEMQKAQSLGADGVTYSPIFASPGKGEPKGVDNLKCVLEKTDIKVFALGGIIDSKQIEMLKKTKVYGFASIRYFYT